MEDSCQDRQENEKAALKAIYNEQMKEILPSENEWTCSEIEWIPLECILTLYPQSSVGPQQRKTPLLDLHITCSHYYPDEIPNITIDSCKGLSRENANILLHELRNLADTLKGEVMIFELAQHVEKFLHQYNQPGFESFYEEMVTRQRSQKEKELQKKQADEEKKREEIRLEIMTRQQAVKAEKKALRRRRSSLRHSDEISETEDFGKFSPKHKFDKKIIQGFMDEAGNDVIETGEHLNIYNEETDYRPWNILSMGQSRFENEFEHIKWLGEGAFGDVIKVRNKLDDGLYAIKRIKLNPKNIQLNKKITREVKLLSRLNHENVVRYYNSWIESAVEEPETQLDTEESRKTTNLQNMLVEMLPRKEPSLEWNTKLTESLEESSDDECWITFKSASDGDEVTAPNDSTVDTYEKDSFSSTCLEYMYIQMELCDKSTLRRAIDENLYIDVKRVWRLFREIVEGLCHIHQQGIIHRDLKPVNIFLDYDDHVKIGDFGLATTIILHKQSSSRELCLESHDKTDANNLHSHTFHTGDLSQTGQIGTALYVAPELKSRVSKVPYNEKVDIFSLGIIFFEMCHISLQTGMERYKIITDLRQQEPLFPSDFPYNGSSPQCILIRWMLNYDEKKRPSSQQLLQSESIPPPELEEAEVREMVRHTISNPQSKDYKHLIASCFNQRTSPVIDATYDTSSWRDGWFLLLYEYVTEKLKKVFWRHGAVSLHPPLLTPAVEPAETSVRLMTQWGGIVFATYDLRTPFARYLAHNTNITRLKRYVIDKVYREKRVHGLHPKEMYECSFDIVTPTVGDQMSECEMLSVIWEILLEFPSWLIKNCTIHLNHSSLIAAMLMHCSIDQEKDKELCLEIYKAKSDHRSKPELEAHLKSLNLPEHTVLALINFMDVEGPLNTVKSFLISVLKDNGLIALCKQGFRHLEYVISMCGTLGITCSVVVTLGFMQNAQMFSGLMCQVVLNQRTKQKNVEHVIISGGRYDNLLQSCRKALAVVSEGSQSVTGFTLSIDKLISMLSSQEKPAAVDVLICSLGQSQMTTGKLCLIRDLWKSGIRTSCFNTMQSLEEIKTYCQELNIPSIVTLKDTEPGYARVWTWAKEKFQEKKVVYGSIIEYLHRTLDIKNSCFDINPTKSEMKLTNPTESSKITFIYKPEVKRRSECQIWNCLSSTLQRFSNKVKVEIIALNLGKELVKRLWYYFESDSKEQELSSIREGYPRHRRQISEAIEYIEDIKKNDNSSVLILFSVPDNTFKVVL